MKKLFLPFFICVISSQFLSGQVSMNTNLLDTWITPGDSTTFYNDVWGYTSADGTEYVIAGSKTKAHFLKIETDLTLTEVISFTPGSSSSWRDFKAYRNFVYGVADSGSTEGLSVYNMDSLPLASALVKQDNSDFDKAHNIYIDTSKARLYVAGSNSRSNGLIVYDLADPADPVKLSDPALSPGYVHDLFVRDDIAYCSHGNNGYYIWDFTVASAPVQIGGVNLETGYNHSSWVTEDGNAAFFAEETSGRPITVLDISDPANYDPIAYIKEPLLAPLYTNNVAHNPFLKGDLLYVSYYEDGLQVWNVSDLDNIIKVAYYDTEPANTTYHGTTRNWGAYPFFTDNKAVMTDTKNGIVLVQLTSAALPLEFIDFKLKKVNNNLKLSWRTAGEYNVSHFEVQHSRDGVNFRYLDQYNAGGSISSIKKYAHIDVNPQRGINYYRIKSVDLDGQINYTPIKSYDFNSKGDIRLFPNPNTSEFYIQNIELNPDDQFFIKIINVSGKVVGKELKSEGHTDFYFKHSLPSGNYIVELYKNGRNYRSQKMTVAE